MLIDSSNGKAKNVSVDLSVRQSSSAHEDVPDLYPEPDSIHTHPPLSESLVSNRDGEDKSVLRPQPLLVLENDDSTRTSNSREDGKLAANATQVSTGSFQRARPTSSLNRPTSSTVSAQNNGGNDGAAEAAESADVIGDTMIKPSQPQSNKGQRRPGVILLGRGNSFSLGRSEVIFLHNTKPYVRNKGQTIQQQGMANDRDRTVGAGPPSRSSAAAKTSSGAEDAHTPSTVTFSNHGPSSGTSDTEPGRPSPPPLSNPTCVYSGDVSVNATNHTSRPIMFTSDKSTEGDCLEQLSGACHHEFVMGHETSTGFERHREGDGDELVALWARAERIMAGKQGAVLDVLAQFGVGKSGDDTRDGVEEEEEESVWQVVEGKAHAVDR